ncbi:RhoGAP_domain-containing protein [Hexamita inflata]|uniref:RhoGAP domain-containing protein n=1 Tax=Hexamita inflata TaxID=28002 RepID=A0AA86VMW6_9EUKA|nr:RhoGAP domain-containing protein [Hexamita inflata]
MNKTKQEVLAEMLQNKSNKYAVQQQIAKRQQQKSLIDLDKICIITPIPIFIQNAFTELHSRPAQVGIFRISPAEQIYRPLCSEIDENYYVDPKQQETDVICALIKYFYRRLQNQLFSTELCKKLRVHMDNPVLLKADLVNLRPSYFENTIYLLQNLSKITTNSEYKMDSRNLGICFAPNIFEDYQFGDEKILKTLIEVAGVM